MDFIAASSIALVAQQSICVLPLGDIERVTNSCASSEPMF